MTRAAVEIDGVSVRYGEFEALRDVSISVPEASYVAIIGPNGAGKTTLLALPPEALGYVPQLKTLDRTFPAQAIELVITGMRRKWPWRVTVADRQTALNAMKQSGVDQVAARSISQLSGGELQRVYLARSLVRHPKLLVLDEPGAGMDLAGEAEMYHILERYQRESGATVLMITHDWEGARVHASHVLLMTPGEVIFGAPASIGSEKRLLRAFGFAGHAEETHG